MNELPKTEIHKTHQEGRDIKKEFVVKFNQQSVRNRSVGKTIVLALSIVACWHTVSATLVPPSPTYSWLFNDGSGSTAAAFAGGAGENGTLQSGATWSSQAPFAADGGHSINVGSSLGGVTAPGFTVGAAGTISTWVRLDNALTQVNYLYDSVGTRTLSYLSGAGYPNGPLELAWVNGTSTIDSTDWATTATFPSLQWHNVVLTWDNSQSSNKEIMYLDGVPVATANVTVTSSSSPTLWHFGTRFATSGSDWNALDGEISEYAFWNTALSADNVTWLGASGGHSLTLLAVPEPSTLFLLALGALALWWRRR